MSRHMYTCGVTGKSLSVADVGEQVEAVAAALGHVLSWSPNEGSEWDKAVAVFSHNSVSLQQDRVKADWISGMLYVVWSNDSPGHNEELAPCQC